MPITPVTREARPAPPALSALGVAVPVLVMSPWLAVNGTVSALVVSALALVAGREALVRAAGTVRARSR